MLIIPGIIGRGSIDRTIDIAEVLSSPFVHRWKVMELPDHRVDNRENQIVAALEKVHFVVVIVQHHVRHKRVRRQRPHRSVHEVGVAVSC